MADDDQHSIRPDAMNPRESRSIASGPTYQLEFGRAAMACQFDVILNAGRPTHGGDLALAALDEVTRLEHLLSVFIDDSEFSRINRLSSDSPQSVSEPTFELLQIAKHLHTGTRGAFDITAASLTDAWGFSRRAGRMPTNDEIADALNRVGSQYIQLNPNDRTVFIDRAGVRINSGGIGKGFALDRAARILREGGVRDFFIHGGRSSMLAAGDRHDERLLNARDGKWEGGWRIAVRHPLQPQYVLGELCLRDQALGTTGPANQYFYYQGKRYGHVIDPRTGWPAEGMLSITVITRNATRADALATGLFVMGVDAAVQYCRHHPDVGMLAVLPGKRQGEVELVTSNLDERVWFPESAPTRT